MYNLNFYLKMKTTNNAYMAELSVEEMKEKNGGLPWILPFLGGALLGDILLNPSEHWEAFKEGFREGQK